ncbi:unnamed protein product [Diamesa serratosioi]
MFRVKHITSYVFTGKIADPKQIHGISGLNLMGSVLYLDFIITNKKSSALKVVHVTYDSGKSLKKHVPFIQVMPNKSKELRLVPMVSYKADIKDVFLNLYDCEVKGFNINVRYNYNGDKVSGTYFIYIPRLEDQHKWISNVIEVKDEGIEKKAPYELKKLYLNNFEKYFEKTHQELRLNSDFALYVSLPRMYRARHFDIIDMFKLKLMIEDLKQNEDFKKKQLNDQLIQRYTSAPVELKDKMIEHISQHLCIQKTNKILDSAFFIVMQNNKRLLNLEDIDGICLTKMANTEGSIDNSAVKITTNIDYIVNNEILIFHINSNTDDHDLDCLYNVQFLPNRAGICMAYAALEKYYILNCDHYYISFDAPNFKMSCIRGFSQKFKTFNWMNKDILFSLAQKKAIKNIVNGSAFPSPYVVYGGAGTGKTTTIVETISQIANLKKTARILVTTNTSNACDHIVSHLKKYIPCHKLLRIYSTRLEQLQTIDPNSRSYEVCFECKSRKCKEFQSYRENPTYEEFYEARVVVVTLAGTSSLIKAGIESDHFDYIFIDDAASTTEPFTIIPIFGLGTMKTDNKLEISANIILCGDHLQTGPVILHPFNKQMGLNYSMMDRMITTIDKYNCGNEDAIYTNRQYVTQLNDNYRSHHAILGFSTEKFYGENYRAMLPVAKGDFAIGWKHLTNPEFPLMFFDTYSNSCEVIGNSLVNKGEINVINFYVNSLLVDGIEGKKVLQQDIGVITAYRGQRDAIREFFKPSYPNVEVGTVDLFQGQEKKIIFISVVRSTKMHSKFISMYKQLNTALTRAKCLLVMVGNSDALVQCHIWKHFYMFCKRNNAIAIAPFQTQDRKLIQIDSIVNDEEGIIDQFFA